MSCFRNIADLLVYEHSSIVSFVVGAVFPHHLLSFPNFLLFLLQILFSRSVVELVHFVSSSLGVVLAKIPDFLVILSVDGSCLALDIILGVLKVIFSKFLVLTQLVANMFDYDQERLNLLRVTILFCKSCLLGKIDDLLTNVSSELH
jgi:hypothetical protein